MNSSDSTIQHRSAQKIEHQNKIDDVHANAQKYSTPEALQSLQEIPAQIFAKRSNIPQISTQQPVRLGVMTDMKRQVETNLAKTCQECCVDSDGIATIGEQSVLVGAKNNFLSEEKIIQNMSKQLEIGIANQSDLSGPAEAPRRR